MSKTKRRTKKIVLRGCVIVVPIEWQSDLLKHEKQQLARDWKSNRVD